MYFTVLLVLEFLSLKFFFQNDRLKSVIIPTYYAIVGWSRRVDTTIPVLRMCVLHAPKLKALSPATADAHVGISRFAHYRWELTDLGPAPDSDSSSLHQRQLLGDRRRHPRHHQLEPFRERAHGGRVQRGGSHRAGHQAGRLGAHRPRMVRQRTPPRIRLRRSLTPGTAQETQVHVLHHRVLHQGLVDVPLLLLRQTQVAPLIQCSSAFVQARVGHLDDHSMNWALARVWGICDLTLCCMS